ncbi:MAG: hypothetical protein KAX49_04380 [Halanaerobiales bacterium]|nr:hypothetical protein [Halanaerobiales bacterium]
MSKKSDLTINDYTQEAIQKAAISKIMDNTVSTYSLTIGGIGLVSALVFGKKEWLYASCGLIVIALLVYLVNYVFRRDVFAKKYVVLLNRRSEEKRVELLERIKHILAEYGNNSELRVFSSQGEEQFTRIKEKYLNYKDCLEDKFDPNELTYGRFLGAGEQIYFSVLDNLERVTSALKIVSGIDEEYIRQRMQHLDILAQENRLQEADKKEMKTLSDRLALKKQQMDKINELLTINEEAMTQLDQSTARLSELNTTRNRASVDIATAREELEELIKRSSKYSV